MNEKTLKTLEFNKILEKLESYASFSASRELAHKLRPSRNLEQANKWQNQTTEARLLLDVNADLTIGGARDIRPAAEASLRDAVLNPTDFLDIKATLISSRNLARTLDKSDHTFPLLTQITAELPQPTGLVDTISRTISDRGDILDSASKRLGTIRKEIRISHDRLLERMQRMLNNAAISPHLQDALVTMRDGRYVIPIRAESKGRVKGLVHDQSSSGATVFIEPFSVVDLNNKWREMQLEERDEERRILAELSANVAEHAYELIAVVEVIAELDMIFSRAKYADSIDAVEPLLFDFPDKRKKQERQNPGVHLKLWQARHPLLPADEVVPIDVEMDPETFCLVITGPNTGGKTVTLKTVGLLAAMAQSGLHIPCLSGSEISVFQKIFADIGDEQSIEQSLSTFSGHITNIIKILKFANQRSLVIVDELGAGTDPQEGAALAKAILEHLLSKGITSLVATHYPELKSYAHAKEGVVNASMEFDLQSLRPTYNLTIGLPGRSNALSIAERLGLPDEIVEAARTEIDPDELRVEGLLDEIHRQRDIAREHLKEAERIRQRMQDEQQELNERLEKIEDERMEVINQTRKEAQSEINELKRDLRRTKKALKTARQPLEVIEKAEETLDQAAAKVEQPVVRKQVVVEEYPYRTLRLGDKVYLRTIDQEGVVSSLSEDDAEVQVGVLRIRASLDDLVYRGRPVTLEEADIEVETSVGFSPATPSPGIELSIRGKRVDEAVEILERHLDAAYFAGLPFVRIVHGKGTGKLRTAVRTLLKDLPQIKSFESGGDKEGGDGVTIVKLKSE